MPKILFLAADPSDATRIALGEEARAIAHGLRDAPRGSAFEVAWEWAVRAHEIEASLLRHRPEIVHFSGHGSAAGEVVFEDASGKAAPIDQAAFARLFELMGGAVRCVVLNACYSASLADDLARSVDCVVGMTAKIDDRSAAAWSGAFYGALGAGESVEQAFEWARAQMKVLELPGAAVMQIVHRQGTSLVQLIPPAPAAAPPPRAAAGEYRVCSAMFVDLSEVTALLGRIDAEAVDDLLGGAVAAVREQVAAMGGAIAGAGGDHVSSVFGAPRASDNDAARAVGAAIALQAALARRALPGAVKAARPAARIGISTGRAFVNPSDQGVRAVGEAIADAERLARSAPPGAIAIGPETYRMVGGLFDVEPSFAAGGAQQAYRVLGPSAVRYRLSPPDFHGIETAFVGRAVERQRLLEALDTVVSERRPRVVTLVGAPGVGRSRIMADLFSTLLFRQEAFVVLTAQCSPMKESSYGLAASLVRRRFAIQESDGSDLVRRKLRRGLRWLRAKLARAPARDATIAGAELAGAELDDALGQVAAMLGVDPGSAAIAARDEASSVARSRITTAATRLLRLVAARFPVAILCEDIHWADAASLDLLDAVTARDADLPVLVVCSARPDLYEQRPRWDDGSGAHERVAVGPLERRYVEAMIRDRLRLASGVSPDLVRLVADLAEGNPFTAVETLHLLVDAGVIEIAAGGAWAVHDDRLGVLTLPETVRGIIEARLDRLDAEARDALVRASVVGRTFWEGAVDALRRADLGAAAASATVELLARLRERQLVRDPQTSMLAAEDELVFAEAATREVAYETLSQKLRRPLHRIVAGWLEARAPGPQGAALQALHHDRGGDPARAAAAYARAAAYEASVGENGEALAHLERALALHAEASNPDPPPGDSAEERRVASWQERVRLHLDAADVGRRLGRLDDAERSCAAARASILTIERRGGISLDPREVQTWEARVDYRAALIHRLRGSLEEALSLVERAIALASSAGALDETPPLWAERVFLLRRLGRYEACWQAAREGLCACRAIRPRGELWREGVAHLRLGVAVALYGRKRWADSERSYRRALRGVDEARRPDLAARALRGVAATRFARGDFGAAHALFLRALRLQERIGDQHELAAAYSNLAEVEIELADVPAALDHARRAVAIGERIHAGSDLADMYKNLAKVSRDAGDLAGALAAGERALASAEAGGQNYLGEVALTLARISAQAAESPDAAIVARAIAAAGALRASLAKHFTSGERAAIAEQCLALLARVPQSG